MTNREKLELANKVHALQKMYRQVLDQAHADIGAALQRMPKGTAFTASELAAATGVVYQAIPRKHTSDESGLDRVRICKTKKYAAILPDGTVDMSQTIKVTKAYLGYVVNGKGIIKRNNNTGSVQTRDGILDGKPDDILESIAAIQERRGYKILV